MKQIQLTLPAVARVAIVEHKCDLCKGPDHHIGIRLALDPPGEVAIALGPKAQHIIQALDVDHLILWSNYDCRHLLATCLTLLDEFHGD